MSITGIVFDIQRFSINNGPGIRTTAFLKGCPLHCVWCHNAESKSFQPQLMYTDSLCIHCYTCVSVCPQKALHVRDGKLELDKSLCTLCQDCAHACPAGCLKMCGREMTVDALCDELLKDKAYYEQSGGGITLSGGEPLAQYDFCVSVLEKMQMEGVHTALDTSGFCPPAQYKAALRHTNLVLFDVKIISPQEHLQHTGQSNEIILENLRATVESKTPLRVRYPMIPGYTDSDANIDAVCALLKSLGVNEIDVSVYHDFGIGKHRQIFESTPLPIAPYTKSREEQKLERFTKNGIGYVIV